MIARAQAEQLRVLAAADDVAEATGDRSTATWLATTPATPTAPYAADAALATALDQRWTQTADAFAAGEVNLAQARVIAEALDALPKDLGEDLLVKAEAHLVAQAATSVPGTWGSSGPGAGGPRPRHRRGGRVPTPAGRRTPRHCRHPAARCAPAATGPPTSTPGSPTTPPAGCGPTSTPSPHPAAATSTHDQRPSRRRSGR